MAAINYARYILKDKRIRFVMVGGLNTAFSYALYALFVFFGVVAHIAIVIVYPFGIIHSFLWNKIFTFKTKKRTGRELLRFTVISLCGMVINYGAVYISTILLDINPYVAGVVALGLVTILSYLGHSRFSFAESPQIGQSHKKRSCTHKK